MTKTDIKSIINEMKVKYIEYVTKMFEYADLRKSSLGGLDYEFYETKEVKEASAACAIWECIEIVNVQANIYTPDELQEIHSKWELEARKGTH
jgi:hypothetical protein